MTVSALPDVEAPDSKSSLFKGGITTLTPQFGHWPEWFIDGQQEAWETYQRLPMPTRFDEAWRYANLKAVNLSSFSQAVSVKDPEALISRSVGLSELCSKLVFANEDLIYRDVKDLPEGVILLPLAEAAREHEGLFRGHFMTTQARLGSVKFAALHRARLRNGVFLHVPEGIVIERPIEVWHWVEGEHAAIFPHTLIVLGKGASVTLIDRFVSSRDEASLACAVNDLTLGADSNLCYVGVQERSSKMTAFHLNTTEVDKDASSTALQMNLGGAYVRGESDSHLLGTGARSEMLSINPADGNREIDQRTFQDHFAPGATSDLLYHNALSDSSRTVFAGLIKVEEGAHETDAYQKVRNLMLSDDAEANSMPGLEILADNVRCTHGATSGELNENELFYMMARGIPSTQAAQLIVRGFFGEILQRLGDPILQEHLGGILDQKLGL